MINKDITYEQVKGKVEIAREITILAFGFTYKIKTDFATYGADSYHINQLEGERNAVELNGVKILPIPKEK